jgi:hypothetical protein
MAEPNLLVISLVAFTAVFLLLSLLAGIMTLLTTLFPVDDDDGPDAAVLAAITAAAGVAYPGLRVSGVKETR